MANVGVVAGNFDVIHPGYIFMFNECKKHCDTLLLLLHDDPSIERPDKIKPILSLEERIMVLSSLKQIDQIITYQTESDLYEILKETKIKIYKGEKVADIHVEKWKHKKGGGREGDDKFVKNYHESSGRTKKRQRKFY